MKNIVILISGGGSNMAAIVRAAQRGLWLESLDARVSAVISNRPLAGGIAIARDLKIATDVVDHKNYGSREAFDAELANVVDRHNPSLVVLAGFMRILTPAFVERYAGRLGNIHPSLLPAFPGLYTHQRAIDA
ncbi:MAG: phosphoribosylglycinamide formyltransferase, partial [Ramlibacter sp.]|nr:phosphoribosylglycinamide formyltransferase [Ramlibacter sp.]